MYTAPGIPILYYGTEIALDGGNDPDNRRMMNFGTDDELTKFVQKLGAVRQQQKSLTRGEMELLVDDGGLTLYKRTYADETVIVAINNTSEAKEIALEEEIEKGKQLKGLLAGELVHSGNNEDGYTFKLESGQSEIYEFLNQKSDNRLVLGIVIGIIVILLVLLVIRFKRTKQ